MSMPSSARPAAPASRSSRSGRSRVSRVAPAAVAFAAALLLLLLALAPSADAARRACGPPPTVGMSDDGDAGGSPERPRLAIRSSSGGQPAGALRVVQG
jgi:hypothetical protein